MPACLSLAASLSAYFRRLRPFVLRMPAPQSRPPPLRPGELGDFLPAERQEKHRWGVALLQSGPPSQRNKHCVKNSSVRGLVTVYLTLTPKNTSNKHSNGINTLWKRERNKQRGLMCESPSWVSSTCTSSSAALPQLLMQRIVHTGSDNPLPAPRTSIFPSQLPSPSSPPWQSDLKYPPSYRRNTRNSCTSAKWTVKVFELVVVERVQAHRTPNLNPLLPIQSHVRAAMVSLQSSTACPCTKSGSGRPADLAAGGNRSPSWSACRSRRAGTWEGKRLRQRTSTDWVRRNLPAYLRRASWISLEAGDGHQLTLQPLSLSLSLSLSRNVKFCPKEYRYAWCK